MPYSLRTSVLALALLTASTAFAGFKECPQFFAKGVAPVPSATTPALQRELCFTSFAVLHSGQSKTPVFVAEKLNKGVLADAKGEKRTDRFYEEARLPSAERARLEDYARSGYDRGHNAPAAYMPSPEAMAQSFSLANMMPQAPENNRKPWADIEKSTRKYVERASGDVYVLTGPVYSGETSAIGPGNVWVPKYLFKLIYDAATTRAWAYWMENSDSAKISRPITYSELVSRTGTKFLPGVTPKD
jgi:endonuclease G